MLSIGEDKLFFFFNRRREVVVILSFFIPASTSEKKMRTYQTLVQFGISNLWSEFVLLALPTFFFWQSWKIDQQLQQQGLQKEHHSFKWIRIQKSGSDNNQAGIKVARCNFFSWTPSLNGSPWPGFLRQFGLGIGAGGNLEQLQCSGACLFPEAPCGPPCSSCHCAFALWYSLQGWAKDCSLTARDTHSPILEKLYGNN